MTVSHVIWLRCFYHGPQNICQRIVIDAQNATEIHPPKNAMMIGICAFIDGIARMLLSLLNIRLPSPAGDTPQPADDPAQYVSHSRDR
jgi:hypothetical protein